VERPVVPRHLGFGLGLIGNYSYAAVVVRDATGAIYGRPLEHALTLNVLASIGLFNVLELAVDLPLHVVYLGDTSAAGIAASRGVGDLRLVPKLAFTSRGGVNFAFGVAAPITFPTGDPSALGGDGALTVNPEILLGLRGSGWGASANAGVRFRNGGPAMSLIGNEITLGLAAQFAIIPRSDVLDLMLEATTARHLADNPNVANLPIELFGGVGIKPHPDWTIELGGAGGLTRGLDGPRFRLIAGVRYNPNPATDYKDSDNDGVSDNADRCPRRAEDQDGFEDEDGCPESDNDRDGVPDDRDECPDESEGRFGDGDGCPEGEARFEHGRIILKGKIQFESGSTTLKPKSQKLLDRVAALIKQHPEIRRVRVEGHTDEVGPAMTNQALSERRAEAVRRGLIQRGIAPGRVVARGYGESRPIAPNKTAAGRAKNRRVEFVLID
ncbi:MAG TPA: OmpA family protein, partial [Myxococcaceae bacterium]|nr:OmpA family protein [Myxococcaceae bacterium]